jgi:hypothetical protein
MSEAKKFLSEKDKHEKRTLKQNDALHLYFTLLADALNESGFDMKKTIKVDIPWTPMTVKEYLWRPIQQTFLMKRSTTQLEKVKEIDDVYDILNRVIGERCGVHVPFPNIEDMLDKQNKYAK